MSVIEGFECRFGTSCKYSHDKDAYLSKNPEQLQGPCPNNNQIGWCPYGVTCMFRGGHTTTINPNKMTSTSSSTTTSSITCSTTTNNSTTSTKPLTDTNSTTLSTTTNSPTSTTITTPTTLTTSTTTTKPSTFTTINPFSPPSKPCEFKRVAKDLLIRLRKKEYCFEATEKVLKEHSLGRWEVFYL